MLAAEQKMYLYKISDNTINVSHVEGQAAVDLTLAVKLLKSLLQHIEMHSSPFLHT